jgi:hypothetical protein
MIGYRYFSREVGQIGLLDDVPSHVAQPMRLWLDRADRALADADWSGFNDCATSIGEDVAVEARRLGF